MKRNQQSGNVVFNILLVVMFIIIGVLIYILAGGPVPKLGDTRGVKSPDMEFTDDDATVAQITSRDTGEFSDGLVRPSFSEQYPLDEFGAGIAERAVFDIDINDDGRMDRITRVRNENGTDHGYYEYKIELNQNGNWVDITPDGFRTTEGAECALQKLQFNFRPQFSVVKISRKWSETWVTPTMATRTVYTFNDGKLQASAPQELKTVCDVTDLF